MQQQRSDSEVNQRMAYVLGKLDANDVDLLSLRSEIRLHGQAVRQEQKRDIQSLIHIRMSCMEVALLEPIMVKGGCKWTQSVSGSHSKLTWWVVSA